MLGGLNDDPSISQFRFALEEQKRFHPHYQRLLTLSKECASAGSPYPIREKMGPLTLILKIVRGIGFIELPLVSSKKTPLGYVFSPMRYLLRETLWKEHVGWESANKRTWVKKYRLIIWPITAPDRTFLNLHALFLGFTPYWTMCRVQPRIWIISNHSYLIVLMKASEACL